MEDMIYKQWTLYSLDEEFPHPGYSVKESKEEMALHEINTLQIASNLGKDGAIINIEIFKTTQDFINWHQHNDKTVPFRTLPAMIDTGAAITSIDEKFINDINLVKVEGGSQAVGFGGAKLSDKFRCIVYNRIFKHIALPMSIINNDFSHEPYKAILGRDFLENFTLIYDGWSNTFRLINVNV